MPSQTLAVLPSQVMMPCAQGGSPVLLVVSVVALPVLSVTLSWPVLFVPLVASVLSVVGPSTVVAVPGSLLGPAVVGSVVEVVGPTVVLVVLPVSLVAAVLA